MVARRNHRTGLALVLQWSGFGFSRATTGDHKGPPRHAHPALAPTGHVQQSALFGQCALARPGGLAGVRIATLEGK